jgi:hypothetical protein
MFVIGIDPHRVSRTAAVVNGAEELVDEYGWWRIAGSTNGCSSGPRRSRRGSGR